MIVYTPFWETLKKRNMTAYYLIKYRNVSHSVINRLRKNTPMNTNTLNNFCKMLDCSLEEVAKYVPDDEVE